MTQLSKALFSSEKEDWETPQDFFNRLDKEFHFNLDPCADEKNAKCKKFFTKEQDGLLQDWGGKEFSAIHRMDAKQQANGLKNATKRQKSLKRSLWHSFQHVPIQGFFMITYIIKQRYAL